MSSPPAAEPASSVPFALQDVVSIGYLYLLAVGLVSDSIYYGFLGITILSYSDVLDVLLSPVTYLEREPRFFLVIVAVTIGTSLQIAWQRRRHARRASDPAYVERLGGLEKIANNTRTLRLMQVIIPASVVFAGYAGYAAGAGRPLATRLAEGTLRSDHRLAFASGDTVQARVLGSNSNFIFYVREGSRRVTISPLKENVAAIEAL
jgi:hypothetical protein